MAGLMVVCATAGAASTEAANKATSGPIQRFMTVPFSLVRVWTGAQAGSRRRAVLYFSLRGTGLAILALPDRPSLTAWGEIHGRVRPHHPQHHPRPAFPRPQPQQRHL